MDTRKKRLLQSNREKIVKDLIASDISDQLYSSGVLSDGDIENIRSQNVRENGARCLLDILERTKVPGAYEVLIEALRPAYSWLATLLEQHHPLNGMDNVDRTTNEREQEYRDALALGNVPRLPNLRVERSRDKTLVQEALRNMRRGDPVALWGMAGCGKTVLAAWAIQDKQLLYECFNMHVFWLNAGEARSPQEAAILLHRLGRMIDAQFSFEDEELMKVNLTRILATSVEYSDALLVLDDVCDKSILPMFSLGCKMLLTTQNLDFVDHLPKDRILEVNNGFSLTETLQLFSEGIDVPVEQLPNEAREIHELCKGSPLAIALLASTMQQHKRAAGNVERWKDYVREIKDKNNKYSWLANIFRRRNKELKRDFVANTIKHCLDRQSPETLELLKYFVLFPEDVNIPYGTLEVVLGKSKYEIEDIVLNLRNKALVCSAYNEELKCYVCGIHTMLQGYLLDKLNEEQQCNMHRQIIKNYELVANYDYANLPNDNYIYTYIGYHLRKAKLVNKFKDLYFNLHFVAAKIRAAGMADLLLDMARYKIDITQNNNETEHCLETLQNFIRNNGHKLCERQSLDVIQLALLSPDPEMYKLGKSAASAAADKLYLRARTAGDVVSVIDETPAMELGETDVHAACFVNDADLVLVGGKDGRILIWHHGYSKAEFEYHGHDTGTILSLQMAPDQKRFLSLGTDGLVKIWKIDEQFSPICQQNGIRNNECIPSPRTRQPNWINVIDQTSERPPDRSQIFKTDMKILSVAFSKMEHLLLVTGSENGEVIVWDIDSGEQLFKLRDEKSRPVCACALADSDQTVVYAVDNFIYIYHLESREYLAHINNELDMPVNETHRPTNGHAHVIRQLVVADEMNEFPDETCLVVRSGRMLKISRWHITHAEGGKVTLNVTSHQTLDQLTDPNKEYTCAVVTFDNPFLIVGTSAGALLIWSLKDGKHRELVPSSLSSAFCLDTFLDEKSNSDAMYLLLSGGKDGRVRRWQVSPDIFELNIYNNDEVRFTGTFAAHWIDGNKPLVAATTENCNVHVYQGCALLAESPRTPQSPTCLVVVPDGQHVAIGHVGGSVHMYNYRMKIQKQVMHLTGDVSFLECMADGAGSVVLVAATNDGCIMTAVNGKCLLLQKAGHSLTGLILSVCVDHSLLTVTSDGCVKIWNYARGELNDVLKAANEGGVGTAVTAACVTVRRDRLCMLRADGHVCTYILDGSCKFIKDRKLGETSHLTACSWSCDSRHLAVGDSSGCVYVLHVSSANNDISELARLSEHRGSVRSLIWSPPPGLGAPLVLMSAAERLVGWWDAGQLVEKANTGLNARRRSGGRRSRHEPLNLMTLESVLPQVMISPVWQGKRGQPHKQQLLGTFPLAGEVRLVCPSPDFTRFVTVDAGGVLHILSVLRLDDATSSPEPLNSPT